jgi:hypothetical protein
MSSGNRIDAGPIRSFVCSPGKNIFAKSWTDDAVHIHKAIPTRHANCQSSFCLSMMMRWTPFNNRAEPPLGSDSFFESSSKIASRVAILMLTAEFSRLIPNHQRVPLSQSTSDITSLRRLRRASRCAAAGPGLTVIRPEKARDFPSE